MRGLSLAQGPGASLHQASTVSSRAPASGKLCRLGTYQRQQSCSADEQRWRTEGMCALGCNAVGAMAKVHRATAEGTTVAGWEIGKWRVGMAASMGELAVVVANTTLRRDQAVGAGGKGMHSDVGTHRSRMGQGMTGESRGSEEMTVQSKLMWMIVRS